MAKTKKKTTKKIQPKPTQKMQRLRYEPDDMRKAIDAVRVRRVPIRTAARLYKVPKTTLADKVNSGLEYVPTKAGPKPYLGIDEEAMLKDWIIEMLDAGFPVSKDQLLSSAKELMIKLNKPSPFTNDRPGNKWFQLFRGRYPDLSLQMAHTTERSRSALTEETIREWFEEITDYFETYQITDVLNDPSRLFNIDESAFYYEPAYGKVLVRKTTKAGYSFMENSKVECQTVLVGGSAAGLFLPPMTVLKLERLNSVQLEGVPDSWAIGCSESGWMDNELFYDYIEHTFYPFLVKENVQFPVALFIDRHLSHLTLKTTEFCKERNIILLAFIPNANNLLQPADNGIIRPLKNHWAKFVPEYLQSTEAQRLDRISFCLALNMIIQQTVTPEIISSAFRDSGIFPFDVNNVNYELLPKRITNPSTTSTDTSIPSSSSTNPSTPMSAALDVFEQSIGLQLTTDFNNFFKHDSEWPNDTNKGLYEVWKQMKLKAEASQMSENHVEDQSDQINHNNSLINEIEEFLVVNEAEQCQQSIPSTPSSSKIEITEGLENGNIRTIHPTFDLPSTINTPNITPFKRPILSAKIKVETPLRDVGMIDFTIGKYVLIEGKYKKIIPGVIVKNNNNTVIQVNLMISCGQYYWKWPEVKKLDWINVEKVLRNAKAPIKVSKRGTFKVPEIVECYKRKFKSIVSEAQDNFEKSK